MAVLCYLSVISCRQIVCILYCNMPDDQGKGGNFKGNCSAALGGGGGGKTVEDNLVLSTEFIL